jgi:hypothetical protein
MKKVYLVFDKNDPSPEPLGVFTTRERVDRFIRKYRTFLQISETNPEDEAIRVEIFQLNKIILDD